MERIISPTIFYSSPDIKFITLSISESMRTDDSYLTQITAILLATMRQNKQYTIQLTAYEAQIIRNELEVLMRLLNIKTSVSFPANTGGLQCLIFWI